MYMGRWLYMEIRGVFWRKVVYGKKVLYEKRGV